ncbi:MAG: DUF21 domain-containing protein [Phycisphaeraceae bacterium]|nr:DUF21 domain-containing protein [Phycisphaeraceae bacterium]
MNDHVYWLSWAMVVVGFTGSAIYSGVETGIYSINRVRLELLAEQGRRSAWRLKHLLARPTSVLSTLLIGNNLANYVGTAGVTLLLEQMGLRDWQVIIANILIVTPLLFVFGETLPKDLFAAHSDVLTYRMSWLLEGSRRVFRVMGLLPLVELISLRLTGSIHPQAMRTLHPRRQVEMLVREGVGRGLLSDEQSAIIERVMALSERTVDQEAVPWERVVKVNIDDPPSSLWALADQTSLSRFPVVDDEGIVLGIVSLYDALQHEQDQCPSIGTLMKPAPAIEAGTLLRLALDRFQREKLALAIVVGEQYAPRGLVTVKDLIEPIIGDLASW